MIKFTTLGAFHIAYFVSEWNRSTDIELKKHIRSLIQSRRAACAQAGVQKIRGMFDESVKANVNVVSMSSLENYIFGMIWGESLPAENQTRKELAVRDVGFYFDEKFKVGHFEQLPPPEFNCLVVPEAVEPTR